MALCVPGTPVVISWDGTPVRAGRLDAVCSATVRFRPPDGDSGPGQHEVRAQVGGSTEMFAAAYVIDATGDAPSADPMGVPTDGTDGATMDPGAGMGDGTDMGDGTAMGTDDPAPSPSPSGRPASDFVPIPSPAATAGGTLADSPQTGGGVPGGTWLFLFGGLLIGVGSAVLIQMVRSSRRGVRV